MAGAEAVSTEAAGALAAEADSGPALRRHRAWVGAIPAECPAHPAPRVDPTHVLAAAAIVCTPVRPTETSELRILSLRLVALQTASGIRLVVPPYLVGPRFLHRRLEARRIRDVAGRYSAEIGQPPRARRGL
jgi:hypothetical protein